MAADYFLLFEEDQWLWEKLDLSMLASLMTRYPLDLTRAG